MTSAALHNHTPRLALCDLAAAQLRLRARQPLRDIHLILGQHLLPSVLPLVDLLIEIGLEPQRLIVVGKCYSAHPQVIEALRGYGIELHVPARKAPGRYDEALTWEARQIWRAASHWATGSGIIAVDHGGFLRNALDRRLHLPCVAIEHTSRGTSADVNSPVVCIDMARCATKREHEAPIIGGECARALDAELGGLGGRRVGIVGYGTIGQAVGRALRERGAHICWWDSNPPHRPDLQQRSGQQASVDELLHNSEIVLGCTGADISGNLLAALDGPKILASCSSGDREFGSLLYQARHEIDLSRTINIHCRGFPVQILNSGFPINFSTAVEHSSPDQIQVTRLLTLLAILQARNLLDARMLVPLDAGLDQYATALWRAEQDRQGQRASTHGGAVNPASPARSPRHRTLEKT